MRPRTSWRTRLAYLAGALTIGWGLAGLLFPTEIFIGVIGLGARLLLQNDIAGMRASFANMAGLYLVLGIYTIWAVGARPDSVPRLRFITTLWLGMLSGRIIGIITDTVNPPFNHLTIAVEIFITASLYSAILEQVPDATTSELELYDA